MSKPSPLLNRRAELGRLTEGWRRATEGKPQLAVVWGRRRVGKTFLLSHFCAGKRAVFYAATQQAEGVELRRLAEAVAHGLGPRALDLAGGQLGSWEAGLRFVAAAAREEPLLVVLDEVPYLASSTPGFSSIVQSVWDHLSRRTRLMLVLTGSAIGTMEAVIGAGGALRGRPTIQLRLDPIDCIAAREFLPALDDVSFFQAYAACGGYPLHLKAWDQKATTDANLVNLAGRAGGVLAEDAAGILHEELAEAGGYSRVLAAIGRGCTRMSEIRDEAGQRVEHPLEQLARAGFVKRALPLGAPKKARPLYAIDDIYLAFWFRVLFSDLALVEGGQGRPVLARRRPEWQGHLGWVFEREARAHAARLVSRGALPEDLVVGRWWASSGEPCEVDVLGLRGGRSALLGEARWQARPLGMRELRALMGKAHRVPEPLEPPTFALWGRAGVDEGVKRAGVLGFALADMLAG